MLAGARKLLSSYLREFFIPPPSFVAFCNWPLEFIVICWNFRLSGYFIFSHKHLPGEFFGDCSHQLKVMDFLLVVSLKVNLSILLRFDLYYRMQFCWLAGWMVNISVEYSHKCLWMLCVWLWIFYWEKNCRKCLLPGIPGNFVGKEYSLTAVSSSSGTLKNSFFFLV